MILKQTTLRSLSSNCRPNSAGSLRPDFTARISKPLQKTPIPRQDHSDPVVGEIGVESEALNDCEDIGLHEQTFARLSVHVNARYNVNAVNAVACYFPSMENGWFDRLVQKIEADGRSKLAISVAANCGRNFIQQMIKDGKEPGSDKLARILEVLGPQAALYVFTGMNLSDEDRELLAILSKMDANMKKDATRLLQHLKSDEEA